MIKQIRNYILEKDFKITIINNKVDIVNYASIIHFDNNSVIVNYSQGVINIIGNDLVVSKLLIDEILVEGSINKIEFR